MSSFPIPKLVPKRGRRKKKKKKKGTAYRGFFTTALSLGRYHHRGPPASRTSIVSDIQSPQSHLSKAAPRLDRGTRITVAGMSYGKRGISKARGTGRDVGCCSSRIRIRNDLTRRFFTMLIKCKAFFIAIGILIRALPAIPPTLRACFVHLCRVHRPEVPFLFLFYFFLPPPPSPPVIHLFSSPFPPRVRGFRNRGRGDYITRWLGKPEQQPPFNFPFGLRRSRWVTGGRVSCYIIFRVCSRYFLHRRETF